jgi:hypothetical protein
LTSFQVTDSLGSDCGAFGFLGLPKLVDFSWDKTDIFLLVFFVELAVVLK